MPHLVLLWEILSSTTLTHERVRTLRRKFAGCCRPHGRIPAGRGWVTTLNIPDQMQRLPKEGTHLYSVLGQQCADGSIKASIFVLQFSWHTHFKRARFLWQTFLLISSPIPLGSGCCAAPGLPLGSGTITMDAFRIRRISGIARSLWRCSTTYLESSNRAGLSVIELALNCTDPTDYANPIEPSSIGEENCKSNRGHW